MLVRSFIKEGIKMKKILLVMFIFIFSITVLGCDTEGGDDSTNPQEIWEKFDKSLQLTSALQYYSIETLHGIFASSESAIQCSNVQEIML